MRNLRISALDIAAIDINHKVATIMNDMCSALFLCVSVNASAKNSMWIN